ncbi:HNH endonuclease [Amycolatopsis sp. cmx-4-83]|uniref:HNH endonuclease n=1 Tax=Amycolatopsis sp. cmx-4-83 TaxID=2790940 RepID=UPI003979CF10
MCSAPAEHSDHVKPIKLGGWHMLANIRPACARCNRRKNQTWPITASDLARITAA